MEDFILTHKITSYECSADLMLKPECFLHLCQEMAESHASTLDFGYDWAIRSGIIWVELSGDFEFVRMPRWKEEVKLRTNTGKASALQAHRFVEMSDMEGNVLARADLYWALIDINSRRLVPLKRTSIHDTLADHSPAIITQELPEMPDTEEKKTFSSSLTSSRRDIDFNGHINNSAYLIWALDTLPQDVIPAGTLRRLRIAFKKESHANQPIDIAHTVNGNRTSHVLTSGDETRALVDILWG